MSERNAERDEPGLFDLPLTSATRGTRGEERTTGPGDRTDSAPPARPVAAHSSPERPGGHPETGAGELPLFPESSTGPPAPRDAGESEPAAAPDRPVPVPETAVAAAAAASARVAAPAPFAPRLLAALADLGVHAVVAAIGWAGAAMADVHVDAAELPALAVFLLAFSFLYSVVSLAFWGKTPGMAAAGVVSRGDGGRPLTFGQTGLRWIGGVLTALLAGLPLLLVLTGRSLPDRLSGSRTFRIR